ncbi:MAG: CAP domain-containing protein [Lachnospiraceae bacterium]|nr:CAP domain-containing protein [Lachnospiraceae bacterium]
MKRTKQALIVLISFIALTVFSMTASAASSTSTLKFNVKYGQTEARKILTLINNFRTGDNAWYWNSSNSKKVYCSGLSKLTYDYDLEEMAMQRAAEIAYQFSHTRPDGSSCLSINGEYNYICYVSGENIAYGSTTAAGVFEDWLEEYQKYAGQGHRRLMLSKRATSIGIGHAVRGGVHYWVLLFTASKNTSTKTAATNGTVRVSIKVPKAEATAAKAVQKSTCKITSITNSTSGIKLKWSKVSDASGYYIYRKIESSEYEKIDTITDSSTVTWTDTETGEYYLSGYKFTYKVVPYRGVYTGKYTTKSIYRVGNTSITSISSTKKSSVTLSWSKPTFAVKYVVQYSTDKNFKTYKSVTVKNNKTTITGLKSGKTYYFRVKAVDVMNNGKSYNGAYSAKKNVKVK